MLSVESHNVDVVVTNANVNIVGLCQMLSAVGAIKAILLIYPDIFLVGAAFYFAAAPAAGFAFVSMVLLSQADHFFALYGKVKLALLMLLCQL